VYTVAVGELANDSLIYIYKNGNPASSGGLSYTASAYLAYITLKEWYAQHMKIEIRKTSACLATDTMQGYCHYETLEAT
jgi:hypothetical protein